MKPTYLHISSFVNISYVQRHLKTDKSKERGTWPLIFWRLVAD